MMTDTDQRQDYPSILSVVRVVLEASTPLSISTGSPDNIFDSALVRDANGLPAIPGSTLAGVLRHLWIDSYGEDSANIIFGYQNGQNAQRSRLCISWGVLLDSRGQAAEGLILDNRQNHLNDPIYREALAQIDEPVFRDRVRLTHKGAAANTGKFDRAVLPAGNRFAVELRLWSKEEDDPEDCKKLLNLFAHPGFRLGGATRSGLGRMRCQALHERRFDLRNIADRGDFLRLGRSLTDTVLLHQYQPNMNADSWLTGTLKLSAKGLWRIGQGSKALSASSDKPADLLPRVEKQVEWKEERGIYGPDRILLPGSSLKGALAHRMIFHARRFSQQWCMEENPGSPEVLPEALSSLLGEVKGEAETGRAGALFIDDASIPIEAVKLGRVMHNAIDRFTGGVRAHMLFEEECLLGGELLFTISLDSSRLAPEQTSIARLALRAALDDLCQGRLALGSRTNTGNGFFVGELMGPLADWLHSIDTEEIAP